MMLFESNFIKNNLDEKPGFHQGMPNIQFLLSTTQINIISDFDRNNITYLGIDSNQFRGKQILVI